jgi:hypothetical protein
MRPFHEGHLVRTRLLAAGALEGAERERAQAHLRECASCAEEAAGVGRMLLMLEQDPIRHAAPPPFGYLRARVEARIDAGARRTRPRLLPALAAAAAVAIALLAVPHKEASKPVVVAEGPSLQKEEGIDRLERAVAREEAARYLTAAQEVLVTVSTPPHCRLKAGHVDVEEESRQSRTLLERRTLLAAGDNVPSAGPVLNDVERVLREVASLDPCATKGAVDEIHREVQEKRLLLRINLMTRELQG